jgi:putative membrane protein
MVTMYGYGWMWPMGGMMIGSVILAALVVGLIVWLLAGNGSSRGTPGDDLADARRILAERLARGDLDTDEYDRRLDALR